MLCLVLVCSGESTRRRRGVIVNVAVISIVPARNSGKKGKGWRERGGGGEKKEPTQQQQQEPKRQKKQKKPRCYKITWKWMAAG